MVFALAKNAAEPYSCVPLRSRQPLLEFQVYCYRGQKHRSDKSWRWEASFWRERVVVTESLRIDSQSSCEKSMRRKSIMIPIAIPFSGTNHECSSQRVCAVEHPSADGSNRPFNSQSRCIESTSWLSLRNVAERTASVTFSDTGVRFESAGRCTWEPGR